ncbi:uncharacterized protein LOC111518850 [Drosophila willistoni]|uniref:uncharacterized protein LOC111518850 n=1 Tax=Drosophila willistoni TaxID=7260 RepID=UPI001F073AD7|nr:uncharacterized protein LOC111518850 [Drosophila willistoni]
MKMLEKLCCMRLPTAGKVLGWLGVIAAILGYIRIVLLMNGTEVTVVVGDTIQKQYVQIDAVTGSIALVINSLNLLISVLLLLGIQKNRHGLVLPWLIFNGFVLALCAIAFVLAIIGFFASGDSTLLALLLGYSLGLALGIYIYHGILSLYYYLKENGGPQGSWPA